jgi:hypothetical protein
MMDPEHTKVRNEAMRRIKMYKMKETHLPNYLRKKREEMLAQRTSALEDQQAPAAIHQGSVTLNQYSTTINTHRSSDKQLLVPTVSKSSQSAFRSGHK